MLGKLLKYEIKATSRTFLPMYALLIVFAFINKFFMTVNSDFLNIPRIISMSVFVIIIVGISVMTLIVTIQRFNKNLLSDEGYLSFTLPVKAHTHIDTKMIISLLWTVLSIIVSLLSIGIMVADAGTINSVREAFAMIIPEFNKLGPSGIVLVFEGIVVALVATLAGITTIYASITVGNLSSKHKLLAGLGAYLAFGIIEQIISSILITSFGGKVEQYFKYLNNAPLSAQLHGAEIVLLVTIIFFLLFGAAYYFLTDWILRKKLNLE